MPESVNYHNIIGRKPYRPFSAYIPPDLAADPNTLKSFTPLDEDIDLRWGGESDDENKFNTYYDYYFSGEDVKIYIDGLFDANHELDIASFSFSIRQEKSPLYGFWSYNFDAVMTGTRLIQGEFVIYTRYPGRMRELLSRAARRRARFYSNQPISEIQSYLRSNMEDEKDEKNIQKYWGENKLDRVSSLDRLSYDGPQSDSRNIFSSHPPFNFIVKHLTQEGSVTTVTNKAETTDKTEFETIDRLASLDINDRLVQKSLSKPMDIVLQNIHLLSMGTSYTPGGTPLMEAYQFLARDMYISDGNLKTPPNVTVTQNEQEDSKPTKPNRIQIPPDRLELATRKELSKLYDTKPR